MRQVSAVVVGVCSLWVAAGAVHAGEAPRNLDWPRYGGAPEENHYSPLEQISPANVSRLGVAWYHDLPAGMMAQSEPLEVDGVLYATHGPNRVDAVDAVTGKTLWTFDPRTGEQPGFKLRAAWGPRGLAYDEGKVIIGTLDGRLVAIDAKTGKQVWSAKTVPDDDVRYISGAPRVFNHKVIIGHGGADAGAVRGYVTAYDTRTGKQLWRWYVVPGNPADGFENKDMEAAAKTWAGNWWEYGGGGTVWNSITYDPKYNLVLLGTGNGQPWNWKIRSKAQGDNLYLAGVAALNADTGLLAWFYQCNPAESWDYNSAMDIDLTTLNIGGRQRDVVLHAPKNGFFYVLDRQTGKLISAEPMVKVTWASRIDLKTGRPVEIPNARYTDGPVYNFWPGPVGVHNWPAMSFNPRTGLAYLSTQAGGGSRGDVGIDLENWRASTRGASSSGLGGSNVPGVTPPPVDRTGVGYWLTAWNPVTQKKAWEIPQRRQAGVLSTGSGLVFQGGGDGRFKAFDGNTGKELWDYYARNGIIGNPISYMRNGVQYVSVMTGYAGNMASGQRGWDYRAQRRRVITFALDGRTMLPDGDPVTVTPLASTEKSDPDLAKKGSGLFATWCARCHGGGAVAIGTAPDLRASPIALGKATFASVVKDGALRIMGMPQYEEFSADEVESIRHFIRNAAEDPADPAGGGDRGRGGEP